MSTTQKSLEQLRQIFTEMDEKTRQAEQDAEAIRQFIERFALIEQNVKELEAYYQES